MGECVRSACSDLLTREIKGLTVDSHMRTSFGMDALSMAEFRATITQKRSAKGLIFHSDKAS